MGTVLPCAGIPLVAIAPIGMTVVRRERAPVSL
jgi:hypothetical protein